MPINHFLKNIRLDDNVKLLSFLEKVRSLSGDGNHIRELHVKDNYCFSVSNGSIPNGPGWYVIFDKPDQPLYVGQTSDLNMRLNTDDGSRDNIVNLKKNSTPIRNFLKHLKVIGCFNKLSAFFFEVSEVTGYIYDQDQSLLKKDREDVEKILSIFRSQLIDIKFRGRI